MSKEYLEALNGLFDLVHCQDSFEKAQKYFDIIEEALNRLESIDNAEPSGALECLMYLKAEFRDYPSAFNSIKNALLKAQKEHKALEIIKEKNVDIRWIEVCDTVKDYNKGRDEHLNYELTKEEFNLLKEVLE